jgi:hypothetical protein
MARCDEGYLCRVCNDEVENITDSELYLRYVIGEVDPEVLHTTRECHLRCSPALSQFIVDERFESIACPDPFFDKQTLDPAFVQQREALVTRGYQRLWEIRNQRRSPPAVVNYPLAEFLNRYR